MNFQYLTNYLNGLWDYGIAGNDCAVYVEGKPVYRHMTGWANIEEKTPINEDTVYQMYSMTKPVTCAGALALYEKGLYLMDEPLARYIPEFGSMRVRRARENGEIETTPARNPIRIIDLFTMSAGLNYNYDTPSMRAQMAHSPDFTTMDAARAFAKEPLEFEPGTHYLYSLCHDVLAALIEAISGKRFGEYLNEAIFQPLGMKEAFFRLPEEDMSRVARKYRFAMGVPAKDVVAFNDPPIFMGSYESGGGGLMTTVNDYARFANALCMGGVSPDTGARILSGGMVRTMRENQLDGARLADFQSSPSNKGYGYELGVRTLMSKAGNVSAGETGEFGWGGMAGTYLLIDPAYHLVIVYAQASIPGQNGETHRRIRNLTYAALGM